MQEKVAKKHIIRGYPELFLAPNYDSWSHMHRATCRRCKCSFARTGFFPPAGTPHRYFLAQGGLKKLIRQKMLTQDSLKNIYSTILGDTPLSHNLGFWSQGQHSEVQPTHFLFQAENRLGSQLLPKSDMPYHRTDGLRNDWAIAQSFNQPSVFLRPFQGRQTASPSSWTFRKLICPRTEKLIPYRSLHVGCALCLGWVQHHPERTHVTV